jgi:hypothetical protein
MGLVSARKATGTGTYFISNCFFTLLALFSSVGYTVVGLESAERERYLAYFDLFNSLF